MNILNVVTSETKSQEMNMKTVGSKDQFEKLLKSLIIDVESKEVADTEKSFGVNETLDENQLVEFEEEIKSLLETLEKNDSKINNELISLLTSLNFQNINFINDNQSDELIMIVNQVENHNNSETNSNKIDVTKLNSIDKIRSIDFNLDAMIDKNNQVNKLNKTIKNETELIKNVDFNNTKDLTSTINEVDKLSLDQNLTQNKSVKIDLTELKSFDINEEENSKQIVNLKSKEVDKAKMSDEYLYDKNLSTVNTKNDLKELALLKMESDNVEKLASNEDDKSINQKNQVNNESSKNDSLELNKNTTNSKNKFLEMTVNKLEVKKNSRSIQKEIVKKEDFISTNEAVEVDSKNQKSSREVLASIVETKVISSKNKSIQDGSNIKISKSRNSKDKQIETKEKIVKSTVAIEQREQLKSTNIEIDSKVSSIKHVDVVEQIVEKIEYEKIDFKETVKINLNPKELGKLEIDVSRKNGKIEASIIVESEDVKSMIKSRSSQLISAFENKNINLNDVKLIVRKSNTQNAGFNFSSNSENPNHQNQSYSTNKYAQFMNNIQELEYEEFSNVASNNVNLFQSGKRTVNIFI